jgi:hypothetical protein
VTDARLRGQWLNHYKFEQLSDVAWRVFTTGLLWSNENGTDGYIPDKFLNRLHPEGRQQAAEREIAVAGLWERNGDGWKFNDWATKDRNGLGQATHAQVQANLAKARERAAAWRRAHPKQNVSSKNPERVTPYVTRSVTGEVGQGQATRTSDNQQDEEQQFQVNVDTGEISGWPEEHGVPAEQQLPDVLSQMSDEQIQAEAF